MVNLILIEHLNYYFINLKLQGATMKSAVTCVAIIFLKLSLKPIGLSLNKIVFRRIICAFSAFFVFFVFHRQLNLVNEKDQACALHAKS